MPLGCVADKFITMHTKGTTKSRGQKHSLDKFYTTPETAAFCLSLLDLSTYNQIIEPSAGSGSFSNLIPQCEAYDLQPESENIIKQDWLAYKQKRSTQKSVLVVGNPPFGVQNNLALKFINHSAEFATSIAFILPKSFLKQSLQNRIHSSFHLEFSQELPQYSFELDGLPADVPSVFQLWNYSEIPRPQPVLLQSDKIKFVKQSDNPDLYVQRVGGKAGKAGLDWKSRSPQSNYFIKLLSTDISKEQFVDNINNINFVEKDWSVGPRSISKQEFIGIVETKL